MPEAAVSHARNDLHDRGDVDEMYGGLSEDCGSRRREMARGTNPLRSEVANAVTAILLHAEAIRRHTADRGIDQAEAAASAQHIAVAAKRLWDVLEMSGTFDGFGSTDRRR